jgi:hypothetical protein
MDSQVKRPTPDGVVLALYTKLDNGLPVEVFTYTPVEDAVCDVAVAP